MHQSVVQNFQFGDSRRVMKVSKLSDQEIAGKSENHAGIMVFHGAIFTTRKRSLGQGNILTGVCLSTGGGGSLYDVTYYPGGVSVRGGSVQGDPPTARYGKEQAICILLEYILVFNDSSVNEHTACQSIFTLSDRFAKFMGLAGGKTSSFHHQQFAIMSTKEIK